MKMRFLLFAMLMAGSCIGETFAQSQVTYTESDAIIANPSRGLQKYSKTDNKYNTQSNYSNLSQTTLSGWRTGTDKVTVLFRYFMLDAYMGSNISQTYLNNLQKDFDIIRNAGLKCLVRFSYSDEEGTTAQQPSKSQILTHISQLSPVLTANKDVILAFQAGFIGTWGEWYYTNSTEFGTDGSISTTQWANRKEVIDAMLAAVPAEVFVQVRYPLIKTRMYGTGKLNNTTAYQNTANARIGFFNDAFLNNWGDMGTYNVNSEAQNPVGTTDYVYLANETQYAPMTGETNGLNSPRTNGSIAIYEMDSTNWTCLNRDYHTDVWNTWINSGNYDEILRRLGYRFVLKSSELSIAGNNLSVSIKVENKGFARIFTNRKAYLVLQNTGNNITYKYILTSDPRTWDKSVSLQETIDVSSLPDGDYESFLFLPDHNTTLAARAEYAIQFANTNVWQTATGYNKLSQKLTKSSITTSVDNIEINSEITLFPNPASNILYFSTNVESTVLSDITGNVLDTQNATIDKLDLNAYASGIYILQYKYKGKSYFHKIVKE